MMSYVDSLKLDIQRERERGDALEAYVARLRGLGQLVREAATDMDNIGTEELFDRVEKWDAALEDAPVTSLARQKLLWQAEALDELRNGLLRNCNAFVIMTLEAEANKLRRQAEG